MHEKISKKGNKLSLYQLIRICISFKYSNEKHKFTILADKGQLP